MEEATSEGSEPHYLSYSSRDQMVTSGKVATYIYVAYGIQIVFCVILINAVMPRPSLYGVGTHKLNKQRSSYTDLT